MKKFKNFINETSDHVYFNKNGKRKQLTYEDDDAWAFAYYDDVVYLTKDIHSQIGIFLMNKILNDSRNKKGQRMEYQKKANTIEQDLYNKGRIWTDEKIISFVKSQFPKKNELYGIILDIEKKLKIKIWNNGYRVEIFPDEHPDFNKYLDYPIEFEGNRLIPVESYNYGTNTPKNKDIVEPIDKLMYRQMMYSEGKINEAENPPIPGNVPPEDQVYIFDFDDTLGETRNSNGVTLFRDGQPVFKTPQEVEQWLNSNGVWKNSYLSGPGGQTFEKPKGKDFYVAYITSAGLAKLQKPYRGNQTVTPNTPTNKGDELYIDFTPSGYVDPKSTKPIDSVISRLKTAKQQGSDTMVVTARLSKGSGVDFSGQQHQVTNAEDMKNFLASKGAQPSNKVGNQVQGVAGKNKGDFIINKFIEQNPTGKKPKEIHFFDDAAKNTTEVETAFRTKKEPTEVFIYGPGDFAKNQANPNKPKVSIPSNESNRIKTFNQFIR